MKPLRIACLALWVSGVAAAQVESQGFIPDNEAAPTPPEDGLRPSEDALRPSEDAPRPSEDAPPPGAPPADVAPPQELQPASAQVAPPPAHWAPEDFPPWTVWPRFHGFVTWNGAWPVAGTRELNRSFTGSAISVDLSYFFNPYLAIAFGGSQYAFTDRYVGESQLDGATIYGTHFLSTRLYPFTVGVQYVPLPKAPVAPFVGLRTGALWAQRQVDVGFYTFSDSQWHWLVQAEAGVVIPTRLILFQLGLRYFFAPGRRDVPSQSAVGLQLGVGY